MESAQGPPEGWYDDPHDPTRLRWWNGAAWSEHTHDKAPPASAATESQPSSTAQSQPAAAIESQPAVTAQAEPQAQAATPAPADGFSLPPGPGATSSRKPYASLPWVAALAGLVLVVGLLFLVLGGGDDGGSPGDAADPTAADADAKALVRTAQTAIETYATDHDGSYEGATPEELVAIEPMLAGVELTSEAQRDNYTVGVTSASGTVFSITRDFEGAVSYSCSMPGAGACPPTGSWVDGL